MFRNKALIPLFVVVFVDLLGYSLILPLMHFYSRQYSTSTVVVGLLVASYSICQFIASPILGGMSDRYGRRPLLIYSQVGTMLGFILLGVADTLPLLFLSRILDGLSGGNLTVAQAYISDVTEPKERSAALGLIGMAFGLGFTVGPFIGGEAAQLWGPAAPAWVAAGLSLVSILLTIFYLPEPKQHSADPNAKRGLGFYLRIGEYFRMPSLRTMLAIFVLFAFPFALFVGMFASYANIMLGFTEQQVGRFLAFVGFLGIIWQGVVIRPMVKKYGELPAMRIAMLAIALGLCGVALASNWMELALVAVLFSFGAGITRPTLSSLITQAAPQRQRGSVLGVSASLESLSRSVAPILGGWIIDGLHPNYIGWIGGSLAAIGFLLSLRVHLNPHEMINTEVT